MIRSPSQCPGTARSSASAGRSVMLIMSGIRFLRCPVFRDGCRSPRPVRKYRVSSCFKRATGLHVEGLVDRLGRHPHLLPVRELPPQPASDLLRGVLLLQILLHDRTQHQIRVQLRRLRTRRHADTRARARSSRDTTTPVGCSVSAPARSSTAPGRAPPRSPATTSPATAESRSPPVARTSNTDPSDPCRGEAARRRPLPAPRRPVRRLVSIGATASVMKSPACIRAQNTCNKSGR